MRSQGTTAVFKVSAAVVAIVIIYIALRLPGIGVPLDRDEGAFGHMGQLIRQGGLPYRDGLDHKPPVAFYINALALEFVPSTARGIHVFLLLYNFLTLVCLSALAWMYFDSLAAGLWCAFCFAVVSASPDIQGFTASTEMWALLPISGSLLAAVAGVRKNNLALLFLSGALGAIACWTKQTMVTSILFVLLYVAYAAIAGSRSKLADLARSAGVWLSGAILVSAAIVLYFYGRGILRQFIYWSFTYAFSYAKQASLSDNAEDLLDQIGEVFRGNFVILTVGIGVAVWTVARTLFRDRRLARSARWTVFVLGFLLFSLLGTVPGFAYSHYFAQLAPAAALAAGQGFRIVTERFRAGSAQFFATAACAALVLTGSLWVDRDYFFERNPNQISRACFDENPFPESKPVADFVASRTQPGDLVLIEGSEPQILFYAQRRSPSAFLMMYPLMTVHPDYRRLQQQMMDEVQARPPKYIVAIVHVPTSLAWDETAEPRIIDFLSALIARDYTLERSRLIAGSDGEWIAPGDPRANSETPFISVFRRNP